MIGFVAGLIGPLLPRSDLFEYESIYAGFGGSD